MSAIPELQHNGSDALGSVVQYSSGGKLRTYEHNTLRFQHLLHHDLAGGKCAYCIGWFCRVRVRIRTRYGNYGGTLSLKAYSLTDINELHLGGKLFGNNSKHENILFIMTGHTEGHIFVDHTFMQNDYKYSIHEDEFGVPIPTLIPMPSPEDALFEKMFNTYIRQDMLSDSLPIYESGPAINPAFIYTTIVSDIVEEVISLDEFGGQYETLPEPATVPEESVNCPEDLENVASGEPEVATEQQDPEVPDTHIEEQSNHPSKDLHTSVDTGDDSLPLSEDVAKASANQNPTFIDEENSLLQFAASNEMLMENPNVFNIPPLPIQSGNSSLQLNVNASMQNDYLQNVSPIPNIGLRAGPIKPSLQNILNPYEQPSIPQSAPIQSHPFPNNNNNGITDQQFNLSVNSIPPDARQLFHTAYSGNGRGNMGSQMPGNYGGVNMQGVYPDGQVPYQPNSQWSPAIVPNIQPMASANSLQMYRQYNAANMQQMQFMSPRNYGMFTQGQNLEETMIQNNFNTGPSQNFSTSPGFVQGNSSPSASGVPYQFGGPLPSMAKRKWEHDQTVPTLRPTRRRKVNARMMDTPALPHAAQNPPGSAHPGNESSSPDKDPVDGFFVPAEENGKTGYRCQYRFPQSQRKPICEAFTIGDDKRKRYRHLTTHAECEEDLILMGDIKETDAVVLTRLPKLVVNCEIAGCSFQTEVWRTENVQEDHEKECHYDVYLNRRLQEKGGKQRNQRSRRSVGRGAGGSHGS